MIFIDNQTSKRIKDENGFLIIKDNPIAKAGVFDYLLSEVTGEKQEHDKIVKVYRPLLELERIKHSFENKPIVLGHNWVGAENKVADGAIGSNISVDKENGYLRADLIIYNPDLISAIEKNEIVELSPAYTGSIDNENGRYNGEGYEYRQNLGCINHLAVVERGRSGSDLRIADEALDLEKGEKVNNEATFLDSFMNYIQQFFDTKKREYYKINTKTSKGDWVTEYIKQDDTRFAELSKMYSQRAKKAAETRRVNMEKKAEVTAEKISSISENAYKVAEQKVGEKYENISFWKKEGAKQAYIGALNDGLKEAGISKKDLNKYVYSNLEKYYRNTENRALTLLGGYGQKEQKQYDKVSRLWIATGKPNPAIDWTTDDLPKGIKSNIEKPKVNASEVKQKAVEKAKAQIKSAPKANNIKPEITSKGGSGTGRIIYRGKGGRFVKKGTGTAERISDAFNNLINFFKEKNYA